MSKFYLILAEVVFITILCIVAVSMFRQSSPIPGAVHADIKFADSRAQIYLHRDSTGSTQCFLCNPNQPPEKITSDQLLDRLYTSAKLNSASLLGTSSPTILFWLTLGLLGQLLFTGRMVVQWIASERQGASVVPPMFWWMSLVGSLLLLTYFLWRRDPIGLLGQAFGSFIYLRNIVWILEGKRPEVVSEPNDPAMAQKKPGC